MEVPLRLACVNSMNNKFKSQFLFIAVTLIFASQAIVAGTAQATIYDCSASNIPKTVTTTLQSGSNGLEVVALQCALKMNASDIDGVFGKNTAAAVVAYESANSLSVDAGIAGPEVLKKIGLGGPPATNPTGQPGTTPPAAGLDTSIPGIPLPTPPFTAGPNSIAGQKDFNGVVAIILKVLLTVVGAIAILWLVVAGFQYMTAGGNEEQAEKARKAITNAVIGLVIVILSYAIVSVVTKFVINGI